MAYHYSNPDRADEPGALPDIETFEIDVTTIAGMCPKCANFGEDNHDTYHVRDHVGWYWWSCFPGCLPDGDAYGPFATEDEALMDARGGSDGVNPPLSVVYAALEDAIAEVCDVDTRNEINAVYRRLMREQGFTDGNEEE